MTVCERVLGQFLPEFFHILRGKLQIVVEPAGLELPSAYILSYSAASHLQNFSHLSRRQISHRNLY